VGGMEGCGIYGLFVESNPNGLVCLCGSTMSHSVLVFASKP